MAPFVDGTVRDFWAVTEAALRYAIRRLGLTATDGQVSRLMTAYLSLACFPEVRDAVRIFKPAPAVYAWASTPTSSSPGWTNFRVDQYMGGLELAPRTARRSERPGKPGALLDP